MRMTRDDFEVLVERALSDINVTHLEPVIRKELLHYDILYCLKQSGLLNKLVFQGGTSLRLCYGSRRLSEDLDFAGGWNFSSAKLNDMKTALEDFIGTRYGLGVSVKEPKKIKQESEHSAIRVAKWQVSVTTQPDRPDLPKQRIKIEVGNNPAYTLAVNRLRLNYPFLPDGYDDIFIGVEEPEEIMADKLVSLIDAPYERFRDIWDLTWLWQHGSKVRIDLVLQKVKDYRISEYSNKVDMKIDQLPEIMGGDIFQKEMKRFLPDDVWKVNFSTNGIKAMTSMIIGLYSELKLQLTETTR